MRLEQLEAFLAVAETGSFQQAARKCGVSQSTVSRQIQSLEEQLQLQLLHRGGQAKLTIGGDHLLPKAKKICQEWHSFIREIRELQGGKQTELCVAAIPSVSAYKLPPVLVRFAQAYPHVQLRVTTLGSDRAFKVLLDGLVDFAVIMRSPFISNRPSLVVEDLYQEPVQVLLTKDHPLASRSAITWRDLHGVPQIVFKDGYGLQRMVQEQFQLQGLELNAVLELNSLDAFREMVKQGNLLALLPAGAVAPIACTDHYLQVRPLCDPELLRQVCCVSSSDRLSLPPIAHLYHLTLELLKTP
jgi:DNA-binding transcriptional LysR family regulator